MRAYRRKTKRAAQSRPSARNLQLIRDLCSERGRLLEEVKQLSATVQVYKELLRRAENVPFVLETRTDVSVS
jgi:hypothetical protein